MPSERRIVLATRNPGKIRELRATLDGLGAEAVSLDQVDPAGAIPQPRETGRTFAQNACAKARYYARATGSWALADDSGLAVDALGGAPGVHSARYAADACPPGADRAVIDAANNQRLLRELAGVPDDRRTARFVCCLALSDGRRIRVESTGQIEGRIIHQPAGDNGFGYDPLFFVPALGCTTAQLPSARKNQVSHRGQAVRNLARKLKELLDSTPP